MAMTTNRTRNPETTEEGVAAILAETMDSLEGDRCALPLATYRLLAKGSPVSVEALAGATGIPAAGVEAWLGDVSAVFRDDAGQIIAFWGLAIPEMPHHFRVEGAALHTWCAWDALFLPTLIGKTATVRSKCATTGADVSLTVSPQGVEALSPGGAMLSMLLPKGGLDANVLQSFCHHVHFFASREAGERWLLERETDDAFLLSVAEAFRLGERWNAHRFGVAAGAS